MQEAEDKILEVLSSSQGNLLDDSTAVDVLSEMKVFADDVSAKQEVAEVTEKRIDEARLGYKPFATHAALLYFTVTSMANIDPMYQFSLSWYVGHFQNSMTNAAPSMQVGWMPALSFERCLVRETSGNLLLLSRFLFVVRFPIDACRATKSVCDDDVRR